MRERNESRWTSRFSPKQLEKRRHHLLKGGDGLGTGERLGLGKGGNHELAFRCQVSSYIYDSGVQARSLGQEVGIGKLCPYRREMGRYHRGGDCSWERGGDRTLCWGCPKSGGRGAEKEVAAQTD